MRTSYSLSLAFFLCMGSLFFFLARFPSLHFLFFAPFLTLVLSKFPLSFCLWISLGVGTILDILSFSSPCGFSALTYALSSLLLYRYRRVFPEEKIVVFSLYSVLYSFTSTLFSFLLYPLFLERRVPVSLASLLTDYLLIPIFDGVYALVCVLIPLALFAYSAHPVHVMCYKRALKRVGATIKKTLQKREAHER